MINHEIRSKGIGGSDAAAILGLDPRRDAHSVYLEKLGLVEREPPNQRMKMGKMLERVIVDGYAEETGRFVTWHDQTEQNPERQWQVSSADAFAWDGDGRREGIVDAKNVALDQIKLWGEPGTDQIPEHFAIQMHWYMSMYELPWADVVALFGGNDLRIYRVHRDIEVEQMILDATGTFWLENVLARVPPPIGATDTAAAWLKQRFPRNTQALRPASDAEIRLLAQLRLTKSQFDLVEHAKKVVENAVKEAIGDADGLTIPGKGKVTWTKDKDTVGTDWEALARWAAGDDLDRLVKQHQVITREGPRKLRPTWPKSDVWMPRGIEVGMPLELPAAQEVTQ